MNQEILIKTVQRLVEPGKGLLAIDESFKTCAGRFEKLGVPNTEETRREYRDLLITAPEIEKYVSGYILFDETIRQSTLTGESFVSILQGKGIEVGIKVDAGTVDFTGHPGEKVTDGLDGLEDRLKEYKKIGATFAKWRAVYTIGEHTPSEECMKANAEIFAKYATLCQENDIVPIVEPEVLMDGDHGMERSYEVTARNLEVVFDELKRALVFIPGMILKTSMVLPGKDGEVAVYNKEIAQNTVKCLKEKVPEVIGGIVFLSGGQKDEEATKNLNAMHNLGPLSWPLTFSYGRAIQNPALLAWAKNPNDVITAQKLLLQAAENNSLASIGKYEDLINRVRTSRHRE
ncbi:fructose-bisphosphate aldolase [Candidatus Nomurabacteria bacterium RIFCSPLOWO2_01_FULL_42_17]|uniref:Probable fructose-bisphosphate aldolase class 1 n=1 Tax=Candidatus Nomurabacteria bacterium RIFCSPLOWO2_01_FULL_42_17 TaxID=1801780 RepID=A0A1F6XLY4_9BACT|nr:MAG: fructose-bisphosphate aldolase [Candidatus Nomurabacteria bacterium RIFCSPLOWO2_01_FULL_42_17]